LTASSTCFSPQENSFRAARAGRENAATFGWANATKWHLNLLKISKPVQNARSLNKLLDERPESSEPLVKLWEGIGLLRPSSTFLFEGFRLDRRGLFRCEGGSNFAPVRLGSRGLDILRLLVERAGELVSKEEIIAAVWPKTVVEDGNLTTQISTLRRILSQAGTEGTYIQTVAGRGYCFVAPVTRGDLPLTTVAAPPFKLSDGLVAKVPMAETGLPQPARTRFPRRHVPAVILAGVLFASGLWWLWSSPTAPPAIALAPTMPGAAPRLSIVVLPFANRSDDKEQQYFADGVTENLMTELSRLADMFVISRNTAFTYKDKVVNTKQIGRELGVRYVLEGSVDRSAERVRVNA
jgi:DNA-binding winged helix-turn-helix (wHTH) protein